MRLTSCAYLLIFDCSPSSSFHVWFINQFRHAYWCFQFFLQIVFWDILCSSFYSFSRFFCWLCFWFWLCCWQILIFFAVGGDVVIDETVDDGFGICVWKSIVGDGLCFPNGFLIMDYWCWFLVKKQWLLMHWVTRLHLTRMMVDNCESWLASLIL